ncbi:hypothetical protein AYL99_11876 [Fonsecaea erecta]|uniref:Uncharacterized protein n=1 Tax=Fonsecaea erecta TaxID=1367422 RepID=A0A178Z2C6_9EURO|nr:hypothetical protein AYL99_11876 [Fonsecaea erecta]OAP53854.1 hypothetical protein AYL99_11876 [Fonsecaea erecta]
MSIADMGVTSPSARATSSPGSDRTHRSRRTNQLWLGTDDMWMPRSTGMNTSDLRFKSCSTPGCGRTSGFLECNAMTLRAGFDTYTEHTTVDTLAKRMADIEVTANTTFIFYDMEVTSTNEIDQLSAVAVQDRHIDLVIRATTRRNNSPIISRFSPMV